MYSDGTSALKKEYYTKDNTDKLRKEIKIATKKVTSGKKSRLIIKKRIVASIVLVFSMAFLVLFRYAVIANEFSELTKARRELETINANVVATRIEADGNIDPKVIEKEAERLGLRQPSKEQITYISLGNVDNGEVLKNEKTNVLNAFINSISGILEYLY